MSWETGLLRGVRPLPTHTKGFPGSCPFHPLFHSHSCPLGLSEAGFSHSALTFRWERKGRTRWVLFLSNAVLHLHIVEYSFYTLSLNAVKYCHCQDKEESQAAFSLSSEFTCNLASLTLCGSFSCQCLPAMGNFK